MKRMHPLASLLAICAVALAAACADETPAPTAAPPPEPAAAVLNGQLQWFGYAGETGGEPTLIGTDSYANWGWMVTNDDPSSTWATQRINALAAHNMKAIVELGRLLWCGDYRELCPDYVTRWNTWKAANAGVLTTEKVLAFVVRDEPFTAGANITSYEAAAAMVKRDFPWARMMMIEWAGTPSCLSQDPCNFEDNAWRIRTVDWVGVHMYSIYPTTNEVYWLGLQNLKAHFPGKGVVYVADGFWDGEHARVFGATGMSKMDDIMRDWYSMASTDDDAVLLGVFLWDSLPGAKSSRDFPPEVLAEHTRIGRAITGRARTKLYAPTGLLQTIGSDGLASGWACDPDGAWGETVLVDFYSNGALVGSGRADQSSGPISQCRSGVFRNFKVQLTGTLGQRVTAVARDLDAGTVELPSLPVVHTNMLRGTSATSLTVTGAARNGSGGVQLFWRDASVNGAWNTVAAQPVPATADGSWSNSFPTANPCHRYETYPRYAGATYPVRSYNGLASPYCQETATITWIQPQALAGYGPPGSLVVAGSASGGPAGTGVEMWYRDVTAGTAWTRHPYVAPTDASGAWTNSIPNASEYHKYAVYVIYDVLKSFTCTYQGTGDITACPQ